MKHIKISDTVIELFNSDDFICIGINQGVLMMNKVVDDFQFDPNTGMLLKNVHVTKNLLSNAVSISGEMYDVVKLKGKFGHKLLDESEFNKISIDDYKKIGNKYLVRNGAYFLKEPVKMSRCLMNLPIIINNCAFTDIVTKNNKLCPLEE